VKKYLKIVLRIIIALLLLQTLWFKFIAHPDSVYIFTKVGLEPYGRIGIGINGDKGLLFYTAILILSTIILWNYRRDIPIINNKK